MSRILSAGSMPGGSLYLSAVVCTHNPVRDHLSRTLQSLRAQEPISGDRSWELIVIDNASQMHVANFINLDWHPDARVLREDKLGLTHARLRSFAESRGEIIVYIDDDNILDSAYLRETAAAFDAYPEFGAIGGKSLPLYEIEPPSWFADLNIALACRDLGDISIAANWPDPSSPERRYPECAPIGAGIGIRRAAYLDYIEAAAKDPLRTTLGRRGNDLASGEDNDIVMTLLEQGWTVAYLPQLRLEHIIPARRLSTEYLENYAYSSNRTWVQVLNVHGLRPWPAIPRWTAPLRKARAYFRNRAWISDANRIRWRGACGAIEGRAMVKRFS